VAASLAVLLTALSGWQPKTLPAADESCGQPVDPASIRGQFAEQLAKMHREGRPVGLARVREQLPDERRCTVCTLPPSEERKDPPDLYTTCRQSVLLVGTMAKCEKCADWHVSVASGFVIGRDGVVVTNYHVLAGDKGGEAIAVRTWDGRVLPIDQVLAASKNDDLAVLKVDADDLVPLAVAPSAPVGTKVFVLSHPVNHFFTMTDGMISGHLQLKDLGTGPARHAMTITADFAKGSSGAPVLDQTGAVVGIVRSTTPVYYEKKDGVDTKIQMVWKYCIPSTLLLELLGPSAEEEETLPPSGLQR
jgi:hypothetical protein